MSRKYVVVDDDSDVDYGAGGDSGDDDKENADNNHLLLSTRSIHCPGDILGRNGLWPVTGKTQEWKWGKKGRNGGKREERLKQGTQYKTKL